MYSTRNAIPARCSFGTPVSAFSISGRLSFALVSDFSTASDHHFSLSAAGVGAAHRATTSSAERA